MNYYEELGIRSDADEEEIRKAHRRLVKLMHPDQHRDQGLKQLAETQMRRLNSIVAVLLDPEERAEYDEQLRTGNLGGDTGNPAQQQRSWRSVPWWIASTLGTIILTVGTIWLVADRYGPGNTRPPRVDIGQNGSDGHSGGVESPVPPEKTPPANNPPVDNSPAKEPPPTPALGGDGGTTIAQVPVKTDTKPEAPPPPPPPVAHQEPPKIEEKRVVPPPKAVDTHPLPPPAPDNHLVKQQPQKVAAAGVQTLPVPKNTAATTSKVPLPVVKLPATPAHIEPVKNTQPKEKRYLQNPPPPPSLQTHPTDPRLGTAPALGGGTTLVAGLDIPPTIGNVPRPPQRHPLEGEWVYAPSTPQQKKAGFFPPEFIHLMLIKDTTGGIRGEYSARYNVDRSVSPDVNFSLRATDQSAMKYVWTAANGAHGTLTIDTVEADVMRIEWRDTSKAHGDRLTSGVATLVRKN